MRSKTNYQALWGLMKKCKPAQLFVVDGYEAGQIRDSLELSERTDLELSDVRDAAVALFSQWATNEADGKKQIRIMDVLSAVTAVIDQEAASRTRPGFAVTSHKQPDCYAVAFDQNTSFLKYGDPITITDDPAMAMAFLDIEQAIQMAGTAANRRNAPATIVRIAAEYTIYPVNDVPAEIRKNKEDTENA